MDPEDGSLSMLCMVELYCNCTSSFTVDGKLPGFTVHSLVWSGLVMVTFCEPFPFLKGDIIKLMFSPVYVEHFLPEEWQHLSLNFASITRHYALCNSVYLFICSLKRHHIVEWNMTSWSLTSRAYPSVTIFTRATSQTALTPPDIEFKYLDFAYCNPQWMPRSEIVKEQKWPVPQFYWSIMGQCRNYNG